MRSWVTFSPALLSVVLATGLGCGDGSPPPVKESLEGTWVAQSLEVEGEPAPDAVRKAFRFTFQGEKLLIAGNFPDGREIECTYRLDSRAVPKLLDVTHVKDNKTARGIYRREGDELTLCFRHADVDVTRPTVFATERDSKLTLVVLKKQAP
jgi:uncharacterized protein (TIGR03067 family)